MELAIVEIYNSYIHGNTKLDGSYLVYETFELDDFYNDEYLTSCYFVEENYKNMLTRGINHKVIRNYRSILEKNETHSIRLINTYFTKDQEQLAIDKTYLIKRIQRQWRKILNQRRNIVRIRSNPRELYHMRSTGKWSSRCSKFPTLQ